LEALGGIPNIAPAGWLAQVRQARSGNARLEPAVGQDAVAAALFQVSHSGDSVLSCLEDCAREGVTADLSDELAQAWASACWGSSQSKSSRNIELAVR